MHTRSSYLYAFDSVFPKLLWNREYKFDYDKIVMADETGDLLISFKNQLIFIDKQGNEILHIDSNFNDGLIRDINISSDGSKIMYQDIDNDKTPNKSSNFRIIKTYFRNRKGENLWNNFFPGSSILFPNGDFYIPNDNDISKYDSSKKILWKKLLSFDNKEYPSNEYVKRFSINSKYVMIFGFDCMNSSDVQDIEIQTYNCEGVLKWDTTLKSDKFGYSGKSEITNGGYLIWNYKDNHKIYDNFGNTVTEIPSDVQKAFISPDGKAVLYQYDSFFQILNLSDKSIKLEDKLFFNEAKLSFEGKYLVGLVKYLNEMQENIVIYDVKNKSRWTTRITGDITNINTTKCLQIDSYSYSILKNDGKYLLIFERKKGIGDKGAEYTKYIRLYYYQLY